MIKTIRAIPYHEMVDLVLRKTPSSLRNLVANHDKAWFVSITPPDVDPIFNKPYGNAISLQFDDADPRTERDNQYAEYLTFMDQKQADIIYRFLKKANKNQNSEDILLVNCMAGISRSGAIATFACNLYGLNYDEFLKANQQIYPNSWVLSLLVKSANNDTE